MNDNLFIGPFLLVRPKQHLMFKSSQEKELTQIIAISIEHDGKLKNGSCRKSVVFPNNSTHLSIVFNWCTLFSNEVLLKNWNVTQDSILSKKASRCIQSLYWDNSWHTSRFDLGRHMAYPVDPWHFSWKKFKSICS